VLQCVATPSVSVCCNTQCCSVLQHQVLQCVATPSVAVCCNTQCCSVLQHPVLQCVATPSVAVSCNTQCCSVLQHPVLQCVDTPSVTVCYNTQCFSDFLLPLFLFFVTPLQSENPSPYLKLLANSYFIWKHTATPSFNLLHHFAPSYCISNTLRHTVTHCNTLLNNTLLHTAEQHTTTHCWNSMRLLTLFLSFCLLTAKCVIYIYIYIDV